MFWSKNKNTDKQKATAKVAKGKGSDQNTSNAKSQRLREEALANARKARAEIGDEVLDKIAAMMTKKEQSVVERKKREIADADADRVAQEILYMIGEKD